MTTTPLHQAAQTAARRGWHVFPVAPSAKRAAVKDWENRATADLDRVDRCWSAGSWNVGIATGPSGLVVMDLDIPKPGDKAAPAPWNQLGINSGADVLTAIAEKARQPWPDTHTIATPSGGLHLYFTAPAGTEFRNTQGRLGWKIDTRAAGGYVLAAGSTINQASYSVVDDREPVELPYWLASQLTVRPAPPTRRDLPELSGVRASAYVQAAIRAESDRIRTAPSGQHNYSIYLAAVALGQLVAGHALSHSDAQMALRTAAEVHVLGGCDCTAREADNTIASGLKAGAKRPRGAAA